MVGKFWRQSCLETLVCRLRSYIILRLPALRHTTLGRLTCSDSLASRASFAGVIGPFTRCPRRRPRLRRLP